MYGGGRGIRQQNLLAAYARSANLGSVKLLRLTWPGALLFGLYSGCHSSNSAVTISDACVVNSDCAALAVCVSGTCHVQCRVDLDCTATSVCVEGSCQGQSSRVGAGTGGIPSEDPGGGSNASGGNASGGATHAGNANAAGATAAGAAGSALVDPPELESAGAAGASSCPSGGRELGQVAYWCSKVNVHTTSSGWQTDVDCVSGCNEAPLAYCRKFWPESFSYEPIPLSSKLKPFNWRDCANVEYQPGETQYLCCAAPR